MSDDDLDLFFRIVHALPDDPEVMVRQLQLKEHEVQAAIDSGRLSEQEAFEATRLLAAIGKRRAPWRDVERIRVRERMRALQGGPPARPWSKLAEQYVGLANACLVTMSGEVLRSLLNKSGDALAGIWTSRLLADLEQQTARYRRLRERALQRSDTDDLWSEWATIEDFREPWHPPDLIDGRDRPSRVLQAMGFADAINRLSAGIPQEEGEAAELARSVRHLADTCARLLPPSGHVRDLRNRALDIEVLCGMASSDANRPSAPHDVLRVEDVVRHAVRHFPELFRDRIRVHARTMHVSNEKNAFCQAIMLLAWVALGAAGDVGLDVSWDRQRDGRWIWIRFNAPTPAHDDPRDLLARELISQLGGTVEQTEKYGFAIHFGDNGGGRHRKSRSNTTSQSD